jgi:hypothetical protein
MADFEILVIAPASNFRNVVILIGVQLQNGGFGQARREERQSAVRTADDAERIEVVAGSRRGGGAAKRTGDRLEI